jgi:tight adherence protein B
MDPSLIPILVGVGVIVVLGGAGLVLARPSGTAAEQRLDVLTGRRQPKSEAAGGTLMKPPGADAGLGASRGWAERFISVEGIERLYEQADVGIALNYFLMIPVVLAVAGAAIGAVLGLPALLLPVGAAFLGLTPFGWLVLRKRKRIKKFTSQMPDALELVGRALRAGHGLASGLSVVSEEMPAPISYEFGRIFEEQNLGIPLEDALRGLADRVPTMDVRFFVTAVIIQRATGGDLAEVLDKIGRLIRERFQILGQVQALTGEGRISGIVLLAMPPALLAFVYTTNPEYASKLFTTEMGKKMMIGTGILQVLGAIAIKKIITIKV